MQATALLRGGKTASDNASSVRFSYTASSFGRLTFLLLLTLMVGVGACSKNDRASSTEASWTIPELKERAAGLDTHDFAIVKKQVEGFRTTLKSDPKNMKALVGLAQVFMYEARVTGEHPYYYPAAENLLDRALTFDPNNYQAVVTKASVLLSLHQFDSALTVANKAVALGPDAAAGYGALVDANVELGQYADAVAAADRMVAVRPDLKSYSRISYLREIHGDPEGAIEAMHMAVKAGAPGSDEKAWAQTTLGNLYLGEGKLKEARREFTMASLERDRYPFALGGLARVHVAEGKTDSAIALLDEAIAMMPEFSFVELKADIYRAAGDNRRADSLVSVVEEMLMQDEAAGHQIDREMALLYAAHGVKLDQALLRAQKELERRPENIDALDAMAYVLLRDGKPEEAKTYMEKARRMGTRNAMMMAHAGLIEAAVGNKGEATRLLRNAMSINPHLPLLLEKQVRKSSRL